MAQHDFSNPSSANQEVLKIIAIVLMVLDHIALISFSDTHPFHWFGRLVLPLLSYLLVFNYLNNTSNQLAYIKRLMVFSLISQAPYMFAFERGPLVLNIFFTLGVGLFLVYSYERFLPSPEKHPWRFFVVLTLMVYMVIFSSLFLSYGPFGIITIFAFYFCFKAQTWWRVTFLITSIYALNGVLWDPVVALFGLLSLPIIGVVVRYRIGLKRMNGWLYYLFYPVHLVVLRFAAVTM